MAIVHLNVASRLSSNSDIARAYLMVSVTDGDGKPYVGLTREDFHVRWITFRDEPIEFITFVERPAILDMPGCYSLDIMSKDARWPVNDAVTFFLSVRKDLPRSPGATERSDEGQTLYTVGDPVATVVP
jgi:hypothetical protein